MKRRKRIELGLTKELREKLSDEVNKVKNDAKLEIKSNARALEYLAKKSSNNELRKVLRVAIANKRVPTILVALSQHPAGKTPRAPKTKAGTTANIKKIQRAVDKAIKALQGISKALG